MGMTKVKSSPSFLLIFFVIIIAVLFGYFAYPVINSLTNIKRVEEVVLTPTPTPTARTIDLSSSPTPTKSQVESEGYYTGTVSPRVPYKGLKFLEIDVHGFKPLETQLDENDYHYEDSVIDGYTFVANEGEDFEFVAREDSNSNPGSFIRTELYGWGPTVIRMNTRIGWGVPATTRYFYIVKGQDFYGPNFVSPDGTTYDGSKYGRYRLEITQRK